MQNSFFTVEICVLKVGLYHIARLNATDITLGSIRREQTERAAAFLILDGNRGLFLS